MSYPAAGRRLDRVLAPDYLDGLADRPVEEIRAMRAESEQEETDLSYLRRLLQGRLDILRAEQARRRGEGPEGSLVDSLPEILADERTAPHGLGRHASVEPLELDPQYRYVESLVSDSELSDPSRHDDETLARLVDVLDAEEREVSRKRRAVQAVMDACTAELGRRYRDGGADVADLLPHG
ncbi:MAG TPA: aerial mycelium formation protein [Mycobacteriales bacterium]|nr:aerial mycelium formation protein [Mycobacteriales bacterium]